MSSLVGAQYFPPDNTHDNRSVYPFLILNFNFLID